MKGEPLAYRCSQTRLGHLRALTPRPLAWIAVSSLLLLVSVSTASESPRSLVREGNAAFAREDYQAALARYEQASVDLPESAYLYFNKGTALYKLGEMEQAVEAFKQAALKSRELTLEAAAKYNLGNCSFKEAERQRDSDLKKALAACEKSISHYQDALELEPLLTDAARNIEVVRLTMKAILDEQKKREEEAKKQQEEQQKAAEKLKELIKRQTEALARNKELAAGKQTAAQQRQDDVQQLAQEQRDLQQETSSFSDALSQQAQAQGQQPQPSPQPQTAANPMLDKVKEHLGKAVSEQDTAAGKLEGQRLTQAQPNQQKAVEHLEHALESMKQPGQGQQQQQQQQQDPEQQQQQGQQQQQQQTQEQQENQDKGQQREQQQAVMADEQARDILDQEKENRERREVQMPAGHRAVDKNW